MPRAALDDRFHDDPRVLEVGLAAAGLYACLTSYCARHRTDGFVSRAGMGRLLEAGDVAPLEALLRVGLVAEAPGALYTLPDYLSAGNLSRAQVARKRAAAAKRRGGAR